MAEPLKEISEQMSKVVKQAASYTVGVDGRGGYPSSGVVYRPGLILSADHSVEREQDIEILAVDGSRKAATVAGRDPSSDLVLLETGDQTGDYAEALAEGAEVGQLVLSLGRPTEDGIQASLGILSIVGGTYRAHRGLGCLHGIVQTATQSFAEDR